MEAWLKFQAPGITIPLGLGIGRLVFDALNKVEWVFAIAIIFSGSVVTEKWLRFKNLAFVVPLLLLFMQTFWVLPALDARAELVINEQILPPSNLHFFYIGMEIIKIVALITFGISHFKTIKS
jgi:hypothetical protein